MRPKSLVGGSAVTAKLAGDPSYEVFKKHFLRTTDGFSEVDDVTKPLLRNPAEQKTVGT